MFFGIIFKLDFCNEPVFQLISRKLNYDLSCLLDIFRFCFLRNIWFSFISLLLFINFFKYIFLLLFHLFIFSWFVFLHFLILNKVNPRGRRITLILKRLFYSILDKVYPIESRNKFYIKVKSISDFTPALENKPNFLDFGFLRIIRRRLSLFFGNIIEFIENKFRSLVKKYLYKFSDRAIEEFFEEKVLKNRWFLKIKWIIKNPLEIFYTIWSNIRRELKCFFNWLIILFKSIRVSITEIIYSSKLKLFNLLTFSESNTKSKRLMNKSFLLYSIKTIYTKFMSNIYTIIVNWKIYRINFFLIFLIIFFFLLIIFFFIKNNFIGIIICFPFFLYYLIQYWRIK